MAYQKYNFIKYNIYIIYIIYYLYMTSNSIDLYIDNRKYIVKDISYNINNKNVINKNIISKKFISYINNTDFNNTIEIDYNNTNTFINYLIHMNNNC